MLISIRFQHDFGRENGPDDSAEGRRALEGGSLRQLAAACVSARRRLTAGR
jgi:hypothetical protein